jgi:hypothetical protein
MQGVESRNSFYFYMFRRSKIPTVKSVTQMQRESGAVKLKRRRKRRPLTTPYETPAPRKATVQRTMASYVIVPVLIVGDAANLSP